MDIIQELELLDKNLSELKSNFNNQMNAIEDDLKEFHKHLIALSAKYPEQKEILEFIVFINDRIEMNQMNAKEILTESINEIINIKKELIKQNLKCRKDYIEIVKKPKVSLLKNIATKITSFKDLKWIVTVILLLLVVLGFIFVPDAMIKAFTALAKLGV